MSLRLSESPRCELAARDRYFKALEAKKPNKGGKGAEETCFSFAEHTSAMIALRMPSSQLTVCS